jgi:hypothetical protein
VEAEIRSHKINVEMEEEKKSSENFWPNENIDKDRLEAILEPGLEIMEPKIMSKELEHIKNHTKIPERLKPQFLEFLKTVPELYSGDEFSEKCFPPDVFLHDFELIDPTTPGLHAKPYPCTGIRLAQLKATISDLEKSGVLVKGDSEFTSPVFYVLKRPLEPKQPARGDYVMIIESLIRVSNRNISR